MRQTLPFATIPLTALLLSTAGCASATSHPPKSPAQGGPRWLEIKTAHFIVFTDQDEERARVVANDFETEFEELRAVAFPHAGVGPKITIVGFENDWERYSFRPATSGGEYIDAPGGDLERSPTIVLTAPRYVSDNHWARAAFLHELTHRFVALTYGGLPVWLNEGLAKYLETLAVEGDHATLGGVPEGFRLTRGFVAPVGELLSVSPMTFYGNQETTFAGDDARNRYYRSAWAFVHFLHNGPVPVRMQFQAFIHRLDGGASLRRAWQETLGTVPKLEMEQSFYAYVNADSWTGTEVPLHPAVLAIIESVRTMREDEVHLLWARIADRTLPSSDSRSAEAQIEQAELAAPGSAEASYMRGCLAVQRKDRREAARRFEAALAVAPDEPRYLFASLLVEPALNERGRERLARLEATAKSAAELGSVAQTLAGQGRDEEALRAANASVAADPSDFGAFTSRAFVHFRASRYDQAVTDQEHAVWIASESRDTRPLERVLEGYRQAAARAAR